MEWSQKFVEIYISQLLTLQRLTNFSSRMNWSIVLSKTIKIALIPMTKTITACNLLQNPQKTKLADLKCTSGKWLFYIFRYAQLQNILQKIRFAHLAKHFASNSHLAKEVTFKGQFCIFQFSQHLQNPFKCLLLSLFTNKFVYACYARAKIRPLTWFFGLPNFVLLRCFIAGWMPLYLLHIFRAKEIMNPRFLLALQLAEVSSRLKMPTFG